jgi:hypothetical protein
VADLNEAAEQQPGEPLPRRGAALSRAGLPMRRLPPDAEQLSDLPQRGELIPGPGEPLPRRGGRTDAADQPLPRRVNPTDDAQPLPSRLGP